MTTILLVKFILGLNKNKLGYPPTNYEIVLINHIHPIKNDVLFLLAGFTLRLSQAQTIMDTSLSELDTKYLVAEMEWKRIPKKEREIDNKAAFQLICHFDKGEFRLKAESGDPIKFKSLVSVLNFMEENGFELTSSHYGAQEEAIGICHGRYLDALVLGELYSV